MTLCVHRDKRSANSANALRAPQTAPQTATQTPTNMPEAPPPSPPPSLPYDSCTILWSTQSGRAKACARRTARLLRSRGVSIAANSAHRTGSGSEALADGTAATAGVGYGCSFDSYGASNFLSLGGASDERRLLVAFVSTTGDAEQCDNIRQTWAALLRKSLPAGTYANVQFALFALGDRAYGPTAFCAAGRKLAARLVQLGATPFCSVGFGDDGTPNGGVFADLDVWLDTELLPKFSTSNLIVDNDISLMDPLYRVRAIEADDGATNYDEFFSSACPATAYQYTNEGRIDPADSKGTSSDAPLIGRVVKNERITSMDWMQDTRHIEIQVDSKQSTTFGKNNLPYRAGDVATILPSNSEESVSKFLSVLPKAIQMMADVSIEISHLAGSPTPWPKKCTLRGLLTYCADINSLPEREDLRALAPYCHLDHEAGSAHRDKLVSLSETTDAALYGDYILREKRSWIDVLYDFDSIQYDGEDAGGKSAALTLEHLLTILPPIMPRHFSIASSPTATVLDGSTSGSRFHVDLCVAVVKGITPHGRSYTGLCSGYLSRLVVSDAGALPVRLWIRPGSFGKLSLKPIQQQQQQLVESGHRSRYFETPILCIGAGTGVAPLRSLILERDAVRSVNTDHNVADQNQSSDSNADNILVFGCRKSSADFYYESEWKSLADRSSLRLLTAFSRDQYYKMYVQRVSREADGGTMLTRHILENGGAVYIAGGAKMAHCVKDEIVESLTAALPGGDREAKLVLRKLAKAGKFSVEAWS